MSAEALDKSMKHFWFEVELEQCYKDADGTPHVIGIASDDMEDRTGDRMSTKAIMSMADQCSKNTLPLLDNHRATFGFGKTFSANTRRVDVVDKATGEIHTSTQLVVDFVLDMRFPEALVLYEEVESKKSEKQLSIGGFIPKTKTAVRTEKTADGRDVRVIEEILLEHIAATRPKMAAVPRTKFVNAILKDVFGDDDETAVEKDRQEDPMTKIATAGTPHVNNQAGTPAAAPAATTTPPAGTPPAAVEKAAAVSDEEIRDANLAVQRLAQVGKLFGAPSVEKAVVPAEITALEAAVEKAAKCEMIGKSADTVRNIHAAIGKLLGENKSTPAPETPAATPTPAPAATPTADALRDIVKSVVAEILKEQLAPVLAAVASQGETTKKSIETLTTEVCKGLESMATGFKGFVEAETAKIAGKVDGVQKATESRLGNLEKGAGTIRQGTPGVESSVAKGDQPAAGGTPVNKSTENVPAAKADPANPWRGMFNEASKKHLAARGGRRAS